jgi:hypothetical protein
MENRNSFSNVIVAFIITIGIVAIAIIAGIKSDGFLKDNIVNTCLQASHVESKDPNMEWKGVNKELFAMCMDVKKNFKQ